MSLVRVHSVKITHDTEANILAIGAANNAVHRQWYYDDDNEVWYWGKSDGTLMGPIPGVGYITSKDNTDTVSLDVTGGELTANVNISATANNNLINDSGLFVKKLTVHTDSSTYLEIDSNYQIKAKQLLITENTVDSTNSTLSAHLTAVGYNSGNLIYQESDMIILTLSHETWIQNGGTAGTTADFTAISADVTDSYIRNLFSGTSGVAYNPGTGVFSLSTNGVADTNIRQSVGTSVIGRSAGTTGNVADIVATANGQILRMAGGVLGFGSISSSGITAVNDQVFYGAGGIMAQSANLTFNGSALGLTGSLSVVTNVHSGVNYSGTATANVNGAYGVRYNHTLTANASINHALTGVIFSPTLIAASNNNFLYGALINPTFTLGAFTGVTTIPLQINESSTSGQTIRLQNTSSGATNGILLADNFNVQRISINYTGSNGHAAFSLAGAVQNRFNYSNADLLIQNAFSTRAIYYNTTGYYAHTNPPDTPTSGTVNANLYSILSFQPTSGTAVFNHAQYNTGINQTGGANGITRTIYINPTLTAAADYRAIESINGKVIFGGAGASLTVGNGSFTHAAGIINATSGFRLNDAATTGTYLRGNGTNFVSSALLASDLSGTVGVVNGGTGAATLTANKVLVGNGTSAILSPTNLHWDNTNSRLGIGNSSPAVSLDVNGVINAVTGYRLNGAATTGQYLRANGTNFVSSALLASDLSGIVPFANGGTGLSALGTSLQYLRTNAAGTAMEWATLTPAAYTFNNGLTESGGTVKFGGSLLEARTLAIGDFNLFFTRGTGKVTFFNTTAGPSGFNIYNNDLEIQPAVPASALNGVIFYSPNGTRWKVTMSNEGALTSTSL